jgi:hypothetical protein
MVDKDMMVLQKYANLEKGVRGRCGETYPTCDGADQVMDMKAEEVTDREEEQVPTTATFPTIKAEAEVSCNYVSICPLLGRYEYLCVPEVTSQW